MEELMATIRDVEQLEPLTRHSVKCAIEDLNAKGIRFFISETLRMKDVQYCYWLQGRTNPLELVNFFRSQAGLYAIGDADNAKVITHTVKSKHIDGKAIDLVPAKEDGAPDWNASIEAYQKIADVMKNYGLVWGGDWADWKDLPHYELKE
jgi:hypothetical protein